MEAFLDEAFGLQVEDELIEAERMLEEMERPNRRDPLRRRRGHHRNNGIPHYLRDNGNPMEVYDDQQFYVRYRLSKDTINFILGLIARRIVLGERRGCPVPLILQLLITIRFYRTGK